MWIEADGLIRMTVQQLLGMRFLHMWTEMDPADQDPIARCGTACEWTGFTEWVSVETPRITIGWDWRVRCVSTSVVFTREGDARTNLMLVDTDNRDVGWPKNMQALSTLVNSVSWTGPVQQALAERYSPTGRRS